MDKEVKTIKGKPSIMQYWLMGIAYHRNMINRNEYTKYLDDFKKCLK